MNPASNPLYCAPFIHPSHDGDSRARAVATLRRVHHVAGARAVRRRAVRARAPSRADASRVARARQRERRRPRVAVVARRDFIHRRRPRVVERRRSARDDAPSDAATPTRAVSRAVDVALDDDVVARVELEVRSATSRLTRATMKSPLGIVFEDVDGDIAVVEFYDESDLGPRGRGIREGDVLRATSAMIPEMRYPKLNVIGGGVGRPGWRRVMYTCASSQDGNLDDVTFDQAMKAIGSNAKAGNYDVELVFERRA